MVLPITLLMAAQGQTLLVELKDGTSFNGTLVNTDSFMNINLKEVTCTAKEGDRFWSIPECYIRGSTIKYFRLPDDLFDSVPDDDNFGSGSRGGRGGRGGQRGGGPGRGSSNFSHPRGGGRGGMSRGAGAPGGARGGGAPRGASLGRGSGGPGFRGSRGSSSGRGSDGGSRGGSFRGGSSTRGRGAESADKS